MGIYSAIFCIFISWRLCLLFLSNFTFIVLQPTHLIHSPQSTQNNFFQNTNWILSLIYQRTHITFIQLLEVPHSQTLSSGLLSYQSLLHPFVLDFFLYSEILCLIYSWDICIWLFLFLFWPGKFFPLLISVLTSNVISSENFLWPNSLKKKNLPN